MTLAGASPLDPTTFGVVLLGAALVACGARPRSTLAVGCAAAAAASYMLLRSPLTLLVCISLLSLAGVADRSFRLREASRRGGTDRPDALMRLAFGGFVLVVVPTVWRMSGVPTLSGDALVPVGWIAFLVQLASFRSERVAAPRDAERFAWLEDWPAWIAGPLERATSGRAPIEHGPRDGMRLFIVSEGLLIGLVEVTVVASNLLDFSTGVLARPAISSGIDVLVAAFVGAVAAVFAASGWQRISRALALAFAFAVEPKSEAAGHALGPIVMIANAIVDGLKRVIVTPMRSLRVPAVVGWGSALMIVGGWLGATPQAIAFVTLLAILLLVEHRREASGRVGWGLVVGQVVLLMIAMSLLIAPDLTSGVSALKQLASKDGWFELGRGGLGRRVPLQMLMFAVLACVARVWGETQRARAGASLVSRVVGAGAGEWARAALWTIGILAVILSSIRGRTVLFVGGFG